jgi:hypothetical protein
VGFGVAVDVDMGVGVALSAADGVVGSGVA